MISDALHIADDFLACITAERIQTHRSGSGKPNACGIEVKLMPKTVIDMPRMPWLQTLRTRKQVVPRNGYHSRWKTAAACMNRSAPKDLENRVTAVRPGLLKCVWVEDFIEEWNTRSLSKSESSGESISVAGGPALGEI